MTFSIASRAYELDEGSFALPNVLEDKTLHLFTLTNGASSEFNLVVSRNGMSTEEDLSDVVQRVSSELKKALPKFQLKRLQECQVDGQPAMELMYAWVQNGHVLVQRQTIVLVQATPLQDQASADPQPQVLMISATCLKGFSEKWNQTYDSVIASFKLRRPWQPQAEPQPVPSLASASAPESEPANYTFGLQEGTLQVFASEAEATASLRDADVARTKFYDTSGHPLEVVPADDTPGTPRYRLQAVRNVYGRGPLQNRLAMIDRVLGPLETLDQVRSHLQCASGSTEGASHA